MVGNFCGVLIFVIFVVDLAVTKFHPRKLMPMVICESMMMSVATNIIATRPTLPSISKQGFCSSHYHPADSIFNTNILLSHAICPSLCRYGLVTKKIASIMSCIDYIITCAAVPRPWTGCCHEI